VNDNIYHSECELNDNIYHSECELNDNIYDSECELNENIYDSECELNDNILYMAVNVYNVEAGTCVRVPVLSEKIYSIWPSSSFNVVVRDRAGVPLFA